jgi:hypothetical protein
MLLKLFELPTEAVDNSVGNRYLSYLTNGFYYGFVTLNNFKSIIIFIVISISYQIVVDKKTTYISFLIGLFFTGLNVCIKIKLDAPVPGTLPPKHPLSAR